jgi:3-oxoacyl-[acyl-carrier protein] reductase
MKRFNGKTALITGGSGGIGRELCLAFAGEGANIAFCYRHNQDKAEQVIRETEELGVPCFAFQAPVYDPEAVSKMVKAVNEAFGSIDILVNNAGILKVGAFAGMQPGDWMDMIETNLNGLFVCSKAALPYLAKYKEGVIINISSFMAFRPAGPAQAVYAATKAGIIGFSRSLAKEVAASGIRVNSIAPGLIDTEMIKPLGEKLIGNILSKTLAKRLGTPREVADLVLFVASPEARYISGQTIVIDGGGVHFQF